MAKFPNKAKLPVAVTKWSKQDLSCTHVTTSNFMEFNVAKIIEYTPGQKLRISHDVFERLEPMVVPTLGNATVHKKAFFVPMYTIFPGWNDFITRTLHVYSDGIPGTISRVPTVKNSVLRDAFLVDNEPELQADYNFSYVVTTEHCDFVVTKTDGVTEKRNFTPSGKRFYKLLRSLGYSIDFSLINTDESKTALPLLATAKIYYDWYFPSAYANTDLISSVSRLFSLDVSTSDFESVLDSRLVATIGILLSHVNYDSDYFVSAWDRPNAPNAGFGSSDAIKIKDVTIPDSVTYKSHVSTSVFNNQTPVISNDSGGAHAYNLSQYILNGLKAVTDYMKRHQIAGARPLERYLSRYGITLDSEVLKRSKYLTGDVQPVLFADVTSTADTSTAPLGSFAGRGISKGPSTYFDFESKDAGYVVITSSIVPKVNYYQGQDRMIKHITPLDFYTPEFDNLGVQALGVDELYVPLDSSKMYPVPSSPTGFSFNDKVFGFTPRYAEYKRGLDQVTGDYVLGSLNTGKDAWVFGRDVSSYFGRGYGVGRSHSYDFVIGSDAEQYNRVFFDHTGVADQFNIEHRFTIESIFPGSSLYDTYEFTDEDKANKVSVDTGGVLAN